MNDKEIIYRLSGKIEPVGETYEDDRRYNNLNNLCILVSNLVDDIIEVSKNKERIEFSMKRQGKFAFNFLKNIEVKIQEGLEYHD